ncbi:MAG: hypothetical protein K0R48_564 [Gammaproteobacteria bacterium]|nr:hypothetical protein [Gammaproteobacteria bacterium]
MVKFLRIKKTSAALAVVLGSGMVADAWAASSANSSTDKQVELLTQQTAALQKQLQQMQQQIAELKAAKATPVAATAPAAPTKKTMSKHGQPKHRKPPTAFSGTTPATTTPPSDSVTQAVAQTPSLAAEPYGGRGDLANIGGTAVITAPFIHSDRQFSGSDLIVNYSTIKKNVAILQQNKNFVDEMTAMGLALPNYPLLELSGNIEALGQNISGNNSLSHSDLNLSNAELDMQARISTWVSGFMSFVYSTGQSGGGSRVSNSNVYLDNGFINIGNFDRSGFYGTVGQLYVPFGSFSTYEISNPFNKTLFRTKGRPVVLGYSSTEPTGLDASIYGYRGDARTGTEEANLPDNQTTNSSVLNEFGADTVYHFVVGGANIGLGASVINNVSDSGGMQSTGLSSDEFAGFGESSQEEVLRHNVPGVDLRFDVNNYPIELIGEYTTATQAFNVQDLSYNGHGAQPSATHFEGDYKFKLYSRPTTVTLAYDQSSEALALGVPQRGYTLAASTSIFRNTLLSLEFHHYINYSENDTGSGNAGNVFNLGGGTTNGIMAQLDAYF